jgi:tRNA-Thr(GGU) m(6)t(6)A37 methyltransferase TsaA
VINQAVQSSSAPITLTPIAYIRSCYPDRFGIPRQAGLVPAATAQVVFPRNEANSLALRGIEQFSHVWIIFWLHGQDFGAFKPLVSPPRLGGSKQVGVYATRSPNRPNPLGLSAVALEQVESKRHEILLHIRGGDFLDGTPVLDLKPYVVYADAISTANSSWAAQEEPVLPVCWLPAATTNLEQYWAQGQVADCQAIRCLIEETIGQDPRPAYERRKDGRVGQLWGMRIAGFEVKWKVEAGTAWITHLVLLTDDLNQ